MSNLLFSSQFNVNSPDARRRVILIPMGTTLYSSENTHTEKHPFWPDTWYQIRTTFFQGLVCPKYSKF